MCVLLESLWVSLGKSLRGLLSLMSTLSLTPGNLEKSLFPILHGDKENASVPRSRPVVGRRILLH